MKNFGVTALELAKFAKLHRVRSVTEIFSMDHQFSMAIAQIILCTFFKNIFQWIIIGGNVCWLNPLAKFNNQPDPMKFSGVMALEF